MMTTSTAPLPTDASLAGMADMFRRGSALVDAALGAFGALNGKLAALDPQGRRFAETVTALDRVLDDATVDGDNLLLALPGRNVRPLTLFALARQASGVVSVQSIEIDRAATTLSDGGSAQSSWAYDILRRAIREGLAKSEVATALRSLRSRADIAASRLSIAKARLDLQSTFLDAVTHGGDAAAETRVESALDMLAARDMALATRQLLGRASLNIANGNWRTLQDIVARHASAQA